MSMDLVRVIVSSKHLKKELKNIEDNDFVKMIKFEFDNGNRYMHIITYYNTYSMDVYHNGIDESFDQKEYSWESLLTLCREIQEQPIVLIIGEKILKVEISY